MTTAEQWEKMARDANTACIGQWNRADALQAKLDAVVSVLKEGDHGLSCDSHHVGKPCSCWHAKVSKIVGGES